MATFEVTSAGSARRNVLARGRSRPTGHKTTGYPVDRRSRRYRIEVTVYRPFTIRFRSVTRFGRMEICPRNPTDFFHELDETLGPDVILEEFVVADIECARSCKARLAKGRLKSADVGPTRCNLPVPRCQPGSAVARSISSREFANCPNQITGWFEATEQKAQSAILACGLN